MTIFQKIKICVFRISYAVLFIQILLQSNLLNEHITYFRDLNSIQLQKIKCLMLLDKHKSKLCVWLPPSYEVR